MTSDLSLAEPPDALASDAASFVSKLMLAGAEAGFDGVAVFFGEAFLLVFDASERSKDISWAREALAPKWAHIATAAPKHRPRLNIKRDTHCGRMR